MGVVQKAGIEILIERRNEISLRIRKEPRGSCIGALEGPPTLQSKTLSLTIPHMIAATYLDMLRYYPAPKDSPDGGTRRDPPLTLT